jgi:hypothetical protein
MKLKQKVCANGDRHMWHYYYGWLWVIVDGVLIGEDEARRSYHDEGGWIKGVRSCSINVQWIITR